MKWLEIYLNLGIENSKGKRLGAINYCTEQFIEARARFIGFSDSFESMGPFDRWDDGEQTPRIKGQILAQMAEALIARDRLSDPSRAKIRHPRNENV